MTQRARHSGHITVGVIPDLIRNFTHRHSGPDPKSLGKRDSESEFRMTMVAVQDDTFGVIPDLIQNLLFVFPGGFSFCRASALLLP